jgi:hypothetical protein
MSPYGYGSKDAIGYRRPTNKAIVEDFNERGYFRSLTNTQIEQHLRGEATHYFWADGRVKTPRTLIKVDIDCHEVGNFQTARAFAEY